MQRFGICASCTACRSQHASLARTLSGQLSRIMRSAPSRRMMHPSRGRRRASAFFVAATLRRSVARGVWISCACPTAPCVGRPLWCDMMRASPLGNPAGCAWDVPSPCSSTTCRSQQRRAALAPRAVVFSNGSTTGLLGWKFSAAHGGAPSPGPRHCPSLSPSAQAATRIVVGRNGATWANRACHARKWWNPASRERSSLRLQRPRQRSSRRPPNLRDRNSLMRLLRQHEVASCQAELGMTEARPYTESNRPRIRGCTCRSNMPF